MSDFLIQKPLILASGSSIRSKLMGTLGLEFKIVPSLCDESAIKKNYKPSTPIDLGHKLAQSKALNVSKKHPTDYVIAADQLCIIEDRILDKPLAHTTAIEHLKMLRGKTHQQIACLCIAFNDTILWSHHETAELTMSLLTDESIEAYLQSEKPYQSCGAYQFETLGKWLFSEIRGDEDTILGLPLVPLINALKDLKICSLAHQHITSF